MAISWALLLELALYAGCFCCGIVTAASVTIVQGNFGGRCMLYGQVNYTDNLIGIHVASSSSLCYFVTAISVLVAVVCFSLSLYGIYTLCMEGEVSRGHMWINGIMVMCGAFLFFLLVASCILKIGRDSLCNSIIQNVANVTSCDQAQSKQWAPPLKGGRFYNSLSKAGNASWVNFFFWLFIGALLIFQRCQSSRSKMMTGGLSGPVGSLFGDPGVTAEETEPFFNRPARP